MNDSTRVVTVDPAHAERVVAEFATMLGADVPRSATEAALFVGALGYECSRGTIAEFVRKGYLPEPAEPIESVWSYCLLGALEARRRWKLTPNCHDPKKSGARLIVEQRLVAGLEPVEDLDSHTVEDLLIQMAATDNRPVREAILETLRLKLQGYEE